MPNGSHVKEHDPRPMGAIEHLSDGRYRYRAFVEADGNAARRAMGSFSMHSADLLVAYDHLAGGFMVSTKPRTDNAIPESMKELVESACRQILIGVRTLPLLNAHRRREPN